MGAKVDGEPAAEAVQKGEVAGTEAKGLNELMADFHGATEPEAQKAEAEKAEVSEQKVTEETKEEKPEDKPEAKDEERIEGLKPEIQEKIDRRIGKIVAKEKAAIERAEAAEARATELEAKTRDLEGRSQAETLKAAEIIAVPPSMLTADEAKVIERTSELRQARKTLMQHWDGYEDQEAGKSYSATEIRQRFMEVDDELMTLALRAATIEATKRAELQEILRLGTEARKAKAAPVKPTTPPAPKMPQAPREPAPPAVAPTKTPVSAGKPRAGFDAAAMVKQGVTKDSLRKAMESAMGG